MEHDSYTLDAFARKASIIITREQHNKDVRAMEAIHALIDCNDTGLLDSPKGERAIEADKRAKDALREFAISLI